MNPSMYSALLKTVQDEIEGVPPLKTDIEVREDLAPQQLAALSAPPEDPKETLRKAFSQFSAPAETIIPEEPAQAAPTPETAAPAQSDTDIVRSRVQEMMKAYGPPRTPHENRNTLVSNVGRIGSNLGAAIAGVKADNSFYDGLEKQGAADAANLNAAGAEHDAFKKSLMTKVFGDIDSKKKDRLTFEQADALFSNDPNTKDTWKAYVEKSLAQGVEPNADLFAKQATSLRSQHGADGRTDRGIGAREASREDSQRHAEEMRRKDMESWLDKNDITQFNRIQEDYRQASHPHRAILPGAQPPSLHSSKLVLDADAKAEEMKMLLKAVKKTVDGMSAMERANPLQNRILAGQYGLLRDTYRIWKNFGVPSGKDMEMIMDVIPDERRFMNVISNRNESVFDMLHGHVDGATNAFANNYGYDSYGTGGAAKGGAPMADPREAVRKKISLGQTGANAVGLAREGAAALGEVVGGAADAIAAPKPVADGMVTPWGVPFARMEEKVIGNKTKRRYLDADGNVIKPPAGP